MSDERVDCPVEVPTSIRVGTYANALRVVPDGDGDVFLDFSVYSERERIAQVVARVRIHESFLPDVRDRLAQGFEEIQAAKAAADGADVN